MKEAKGIGLTETLRGLVDTARSDEMKETFKMTGLGLYEMSRWVLASVLHPVATFKAAMLIGDQETINRNMKRALSLPIGSKRFKS